MLNARLLLSYLCHFGWPNEAATAAFVKQGDEHLSITLLLVGVALTDERNERIAQLL